MRFVLVCTKPDLFVRLVLFPEQSRKGSSLFAQRLVFSFVSFQLSIVNFLFAQRLVVGRKVDVSLAGEMYIIGLFSCAKNSQSLAPLVTTNFAR